jgi:ferredoxin
MEKNTNKMAMVHFSLEDMDVEVPLGSSFLDIVEASGADVTFGCRTGTCGTCRIRIEKGMEHLNIPGQEERDFLASLKALPDERLGCQVCVQGPVVVSYVG